MKHGERKFEFEQSRTREGVRNPEKGKGGRERGGARHKLAMGDERMVERASERGEHSPAGGVDLFAGP